MIQFSREPQDLKQSHDRTNDIWDTRQVAIETYKENLEREIAMIKRTGAVIKVLDNRRTAERN